MLNNIKSRRRGFEVYIIEVYKDKKRPRLEGRVAVGINRGDLLLVSLDGNGTVERNVLLAFAIEVGVVGSNVELRSLNAVAEECTLNTGGTGLAETTVNSGRTGVVVSVATYGVLLVGVGLHYVGNSVENLAVNAREA